VLYIPRRSLAGHSCPLQLRSKERSQCTVVSNEPVTHVSIYLISYTDAATNDYTSATQIIPLLDHPLSLGAKVAEMDPHRVVLTMKGAKMRLIGSLCRPCILSLQTGTTANCRLACFRISHIFNGVNITKETASFQLCDLHDPMLMNMIKEEDDLRDVCNVSFILPHHF